MIKKIIVLVIFISGTFFAQVKDYQVGTSQLSRSMSNTGYFDYSKPNTLNIEVTIWGWVRFPGKYLIPEYSDVMDLMSYAGGPTDAANLDDIRIYRVITNETGDTTLQFLPVNYEDLLWSDELDKSGLNIPTLKAGDNLSVPGTPKMYLRDWIQVTLSIVGILISLTTLFVTIGK